MGRRKLTYIREAVRDCPSPSCGDFISNVYFPPVYIKEVSPPPGFDCGGGGGGGGGGGRRPETAPTTTWRHGSSLLNLMKLQSFPGLSGRVGFDPEGRRSSFPLEVGWLGRNGMENAGELDWGKFIGFSLEIGGEQKKYIWQ